MNIMWLLLYKYKKKLDLLIVMVIRNFIYFGYGFIVRVVYRVRLIYNDVIVLDF